MKANKIIKWSYCIYANKFTEITGIPVGESK